MEISKDLIAASAIPLVLTILEKGDDYGYSIIKKVMEETDEELIWKEGSLYPVLAKLEKKGYVTSYIVKEKGRPRKYYSIKEEGKLQLASLKEEWAFITNAMYKLWGKKASLT